MYRYSGAIEAAKRGAVAALVAAVSNIAMGLPHTGQMSYDDDETITRIPLASISIDSAQMLGRMQRRGEFVATLCLKITFLIDRSFEFKMKLGNRIVLRLSMDDVLPGNITSRNTFGQLTGSVHPEEKVIVSGHIDSWDVGEGAQDDGGAVVMSALVITLLKSLGLTPKRSIQAVGWTSEENGLVGVQRYVVQHIEEIRDGKIAAAIESDGGLFFPTGYSFAGTDRGACIVQEIMTLFEGTNFTRFNRGNRVGSDVAYLSDENVPTFSFQTGGDKYFWYHHAESDTMTAMDPDELDECLAVYAASAYVIADLSENLMSRSPVDSESNARSLTTSATVLPVVIAVAVGFLHKL